MAADHSMENSIIENEFDYKNTNSIQGLHSTVRKIVCLENGNILTCGLNNPGYPYSKIYMWATKRNNNEHVIESPLHVYHTKIRDVYSLLLFTEDTFLCGGSGGKIERWGIHSNKLIESYQHNSSPIFNIKLLHDGRFVTSSLSEISVWDIDGTHVGTLNGQRGIIHCLDVLPNGDIVAAGQSKKICIWDPATLDCKKIIYTGTLYVYSMVLLQNNYVLIGHSNGLTTWDLDEELHAPIQYHMKDVNIMCMTKITENVVAYGDSNGMLVLFDLNTGESIRNLKVSPKPITSVTRLYDDRIATGTFQSTEYSRFYQMPHLIDHECQIRIFEDKHQPYLFSQYRMKETIKHIEVFKEELIAVTWSPERHLDWCADIETRKDVMRNFNV